MTGAQPPVIAETMSAVVTLGGGSRPSLQLAARVLKTSPRTLQRRLSEAGVSFSEILERSAAEQACQQLTAGDEDIRTISVKLGYRDPSSFSRAFRRWKGVSPREYRQQHAPHHR